MTWRLQLLGQFVLRPHPAGDPIRVGAKGEALLVCIAAHGPAGVDRATLASLLWTDQRQDDARNALRQALHRIRRALDGGPDLLVATGERLTIGTPCCDVDLWRLEALAGQDDSASLLEAARLARGLLGQGLSGGGDWDLWLAGERQRIAVLVQGVLARLAEVAQAPEELGAAIALGERLLRDDPIHEGCYRALMRLHEKAGQTAKALRVWDECRRTLRLELDVQPSAPTRALYERLRGVTAQGASGRVVLAPWSGLVVERAPSGANGASPRASAVDHLLHGWQLFMELRPASNMLARAALEEALSLEPRNTAALGLLGFTHFFDAVSGWSEDPQQSLQHAERIAARALASDADHPASRSLHAKLLLWRKEHDAALAELRRALPGAGAIASVHFQFGDVCAFSGHYEEAIASILRALDLEPNDRAMFLTIQALAMLGLGDGDGARAVCLRAIARNPEYSWPHAMLAVALHEAGDSLGARHAAATACRLNRRLSIDFARYVFPLRDEALRARFLKAWDGAGMPQHERPAPG